MEEKKIYEIEQKDLVIAYNCLSYFTKLNSYELLNALLSLKDIDKADCATDKDGNILNSGKIDKLNLSNIEYKQLKFLFFTTILLGIHLNYGNTFFNLKEFADKTLVLKISNISNLFESILSALADSKELVTYENKSEQMEFTYRFEDIQTLKDIIEKINLRENIFCKKVSNSQDNSIHNKDYEEKDNEEKILKNPPLFILENEENLYFRRFYLYESLIADNIINRIKLKDGEKEKKNLVELQHFIDIFKKNLDEKQIDAITSAVENNLTIISGGPGTGKTYILSLIILAYIYIYGYKPEQIIAVAPTGKAAKRISESIQKNIDDFINQINENQNQIKEEEGERHKGLGNLQIDGTKKEDIKKDEIKLQDIKIDSITIHRLLKGSEYSLSFLHNRENKVEYKLVIVDEASMIDISLMAKLLDALDYNTNLILSGDANQLSSVEAGRVFSDLKDYFLTQSEKMKDEFKQNFKLNIVELTKSFRYKKDSIVEEAKDILYKILNIKDEKEKIKLANDFIKILKEKDRLLEDQVSINLFENLNEKIGEFKFKENSDDLKIQFELINKIKFLSPLRLTKYGTYNINSIYAEYLKKNDKSRFIPIIITKNNYQLKLFNGDIGIIEEKEDGLYAYFENEENDLLLIKYPLSSLSNWEPAYCLTVHKSQGSEYDVIVLFLPENVEDYKFITVELLYTAITRAKEDFYIVSSEDSLRKTLLTKTNRFTGLYEKLDIKI